MILRTLFCTCCRLEAAAMRGVAPDKEKTMMGSTYLNWEKPLPMDMQPPKEVVALNGTNGLFMFYAGGLGCFSGFDHYADFHGRGFPRTVTTGGIEVTATVNAMEDLPSTPAGWFDASASGGDPHPLLFTTVDKTNLATDLIGEPPALIWPEIPNTRREGVIWVDLVLDRAGRIREPFQTISDNPALNPFMHDYLAALQFKPVLRDGEAMQVVRHVVLRFELGQPAKFAPPTNHEAFAIRYRLRSRNKSTVERFRH